MTTKEIVQARLPGMANYISRKGLAKIDELCAIYNVLPDVWCRWWISSHAPGQIYDAMILNEGSEKAFIEWVQDQKEYTPVLTALEIDAFKVAVEKASDPAEVFTVESSQVSPLILYVMGKYLGFHREVAPLFRAAMHQLREQPWYTQSLEKMAQYLPETANEPGN